MMRGLRSRRLDPRDDSGVTLIEVMVVMVLLTMIMGLTTVTFIRGLRSTTASAARQDDTATVRIALDTMTRSLRTAIRPATGTPAFEAAGPQSVTFYANMHTALGGGVYSGPAKLRYYVGSTAACGSCLFEELTTATGAAAPYAWAATPTRTRVLARSLLSPQPRAVFTYLKAEDAPTGAAPAVQTLPVDGTGALTAASRDLVTGVEIWLTARTASTVPVPATTIVDRVTLPNALVES